MTKPVGRPPGTKKTGGRIAGVPNRATQLREQAMVRALVAEQLTPEQQAELTPLSVILRIMRARTAAGDDAGALAAATAAAPYCHARLSSSDVRLSGTLESKSDADIAQELAVLEARLAGAARVIN